MPFELTDKWTVLSARVSFCPQSSGEREIGSIDDGRVEARVDVVFRFFDTNHKHDYVTVYVNLMSAILFPHKWIMYRSSDYG